MQPYTLIIQFYIYAMESFQRVCITVRSSKQRIIKCQLLAISSQRRTHVFEQKIQQKLMPLAALSRANIDQLTVNVYWFHAYIYICDIKKTTNQVVYSVPITTHLILSLITFDLLLAQRWQSQVVSAASKWAGYII